MAGLGLPDEVRDRFNAECRNALFDTMGEDGSLDTNRAAAVLKRRLLGGVQVQLSFQVTPDPLTNGTIFDQDDLFMLQKAAWDHLIGWELNNNIQRMKVDLQKPVEDDEDALEELREVCYLEIVSFKSGKQTIFKFVGDASMRELMIAAEQYAEKKQRAGKRQTRCDAIVEKMQERGATEETTVGEVLGETGPAATA